MEFPSKVLEKAVEQFKTLPGVGNKTALRLVLHLVKQSETSLDEFEKAIAGLRKSLHNCKVCQNISDSEICGICSNPSRDSSQVCVVQDLRDVMAIEGTGQYNGLYHVLGGVISPMDGIGPDELKVRELVERATSGEIREMIFALSATMEGDTTIFYLSKQVEPFGVKLSTISRGIAVGGELEYVDEVTLGRSLMMRIPYEA